MVAATSTIASAIQESERPARLHHRQPRPAPPPIGQRSATALFGSGGGSQPTALDLACVAGLETFLRPGEPVCSSRFEWLPALGRAGFEHSLYYRVRESFAPAGRNKCLGSTTFGYASSATAEAYESCGPTFWERAMVGTSLGRLWVRRPAQRLTQTPVRLRSAPFFLQFGQVSQQRPTGNAVQPHGRIRAGNFDQLLYGLGSDVNACRIFLPASSRRWRRVRPIRSGARPSGAHGRGRTSCGSSSRQRSRLPSIGSSGTVGQMHAMVLRLETRSAAIRILRLPPRDRDVCWRGRGCRAPASRERSGSPPPLPSPRSSPFAEPC